MSASETQPAAVLAEAAAFALDDVSVRLGDVTALSRVDLRLVRGESVAVIGPSGAGKTTLLRALSGSVRPSSGRVDALGRDPWALPPRALRALRASIGFIPQDHALVPVLRVLPNVLAGRLGRRGTLGGLWSLFAPSRDEVRGVHALLERVGIAETLYRRADRLSGGEQQRVAIARALYQQPQAILADEPVASVDPARSRAIVELLIEVAREHDATLVASLHDERLARSLFDRVLGLAEGRVVIDSRRDTRGEHPLLGDEALRRLYALQPTGDRA